MSKKVFIIAEAGVNHNGSVKTAKKMVDAAVKAGADAVKFQSFRAGKLAARFAPKAAYQNRNKADKGTQFEMLKKLELDEKAHVELKKYCDKKGIMFLSSAFDVESVGMLEKLGVRIHKVPSGGLTDLPCLKKVGETGKKIILSTGLADMDEVRKALGVLVRAGADKSDITVLHCNTEYPTPMRDVNLSAMLTMKDSLGVSVGYSDHTPGIEVAVAAASLGAEVIEKHFTLDRNMKGPDHVFSLEPDEFAGMVTAVRNVEKAMGDGIKRPSPSESSNKFAVRKSIMAAKDIKKGDIFTEKNITTKRPAGGIDPMKWERVLGKKAKKDFRKDEFIRI